jgi:hypothetical protein
MKWHHSIFFLLFLLCSCENEKTIEFENTPQNISEKSFDLDGPLLEYQLSLDKTIFSIGEPIEYTLSVFNHSSRDTSIWIDGGRYPIGSALKLFNSKNVSQVENYYSFLSSSLYTMEEVEAKKTLIRSGGKFEKKYTLTSTVKIVGQELPPDDYYLIYDTGDHFSETVYFTIVASE